MINGYVFLEEDKEYMWGKLVPGCLELPTESVPMTWAAGRDVDALIGRAHNLRREGMKLVADLELFPGHWFEEELAKEDHSEALVYAGPYVSNVIRDEDTKVISGGRVRCIDVFPIAQYPYPQKEKR